MQCKKAEWHRSPETPCRRFCLIPMPATCVVNRPPVAYRHNKPVNDCASCCRCRKRPPCFSQTDRKMDHGNESKLNGIRHRANDSHITSGVEFIDGLNPGAEDDLLQPVVTARKDFPVGEPVTYATMPSLSRRRPKGPQVNCPCRDQQLPVRRGKI